jgi:hypothetical protein
VKGYSCQYVLPFPSKGHCDHGVNLNAFVWHWGGRKGPRVMSFW